MKDKEMLLITSDYSDICTQKIIEAAKQEGCELYKCQTSWDVPEKYHNYNGVIYNSNYGPVFCDFVANKMKWQLLQNSPTWVAKLPSQFRKRQIDFVANIKDLDKYFPIEKNKFIQSPEKDIFESQLVKAGQKPGQSYYYTTTAVIISDEVEFTSEYVLLVVDKQVQDSSFVKGYAKDDPIPFVEKLVDTVRTAPSFTIRVGEIKNRGWGVISTHPIWSSKLYGLNPTKFFKAIKYSCYKNYNSDRSL